VWLELPPAQLLTLARNLPGHELRRKCGQFIAVRTFRPLPSSGYLVACAAVSILDWRYEGQRRPSPLIAIERLTAAIADKASTPISRGRHTAVPDTRRIATDALGPDCRHTAWMPPRVLR
jgi:hypothetical protein